MLKLLCAGRSKLLHTGGLYEVAAEGGVGDYTNTYLQAPDEDPGDVLDLLLLLTL